MSSTPYPPDSAWMWLDEGSNDTRRSTMNYTANSTSFLFDMFTNMSASTDAAVTTPRDRTAFLPSPYSLEHLVVVSAILGTMILATIIGNVFVIAAIILERNLQSPANHLILSLAVADLMVASLVMPLSAVYEVSHTWFLGQTVCDIWTSLDVLCCTASILHLVAIATDRYRAISCVHYIHQRTRKSIGIMLLAVWFLSVVISISPLFGWRDPKKDHMPGQCMVSQDLSYQFFATFGAFYLPLLIILTLYVKIWRVASRRLRKKPGGMRRGASRLRAASSNVTKFDSATVVLNNQKNHPPTAVETTCLTVMNPGEDAHEPVSQVVRSEPGSPDKSSSGSGQSNTSHDSANGAAGGKMLTVEPSTSNLRKQSAPAATSWALSRKQNNNESGNNSKKGAAAPKPKVGKKKSSSNDVKRERKAAKTLAIITGAFVLCWLPFFIVAVLRPMCGACHFDELLLSFLTWLGYFNSLLNPIIYTIFSPDFRMAFRKILCGNYRNANRRYF